MLKKRLAKHLPAALLVSALFLSLTGNLDRLINACGLSKLSESNREYLQASFDKSLGGFLILSGIKSGLAVIEGSEVGVGVSVEAGDIVQPVYDYVDIAWKTALTGGTILFSLGIVQTTVEMLDQIALLFFLIAFSISVFLKKFRPEKTILLKISIEASIFMAVISFTLYLVMPVSIYSASVMSKNVTVPLTGSSQAGFKNISEDFSADSLKNYLFDDSQSDDDSVISKLNLALQFANAKKQIGKISTLLKNKSSEIALWTIQLIAGYLFDCIVFPLTFFVLLLRFTRFAVRYIFSLKPIITKPDILASATEI